MSYEINFLGVQLSNTPDDGYRFVKYIVKTPSGNDITVSTFGPDFVTGETSYYFVKQDATITAEFERSAYSITVTNPAGGTVTASLSSASEGDKVNLSYTVNSGYIFRRFIVRKTSDNSEVSVINGSQVAWYFNMPGSNVTVTAEFAPAHAITVSNPENGSITAPASAAAGDTVQISVVANAGYEVKDCTVTKTGDSGVSVSTSIIFNDPNGKVYSFTMPDYPVTVSARTELKVCPITWNTADCTVNGPAQGQIGDEITFSVTPSDGYRVRTISVNGETVYGIVRTAVSGNVYTYKMTLRDSCVVDVECDNEDNAGFLITKELGQQANVSVTNSAGEEITRAEGGESVTIKLLNQDIIDYHGNTSGNVFYPTGTDPYTGKDSKLLSGNDTFTMPFCDMTVQAVGVAETFNLTCSSSANGTITANGSIVAAGLTVVLTITPDAGYMFENVIVDGQDVALYVDEGNNNSYIYIFTMPGHDVNVSAVFAIRYKITYELDGGRFEGVRYLSYLASTETFTLTQPTRDGYTFTGWTGSNGSTPQTSVTIPKGSTGDKSYTANWTLNTYSIMYNLDGGTLAEGVSNPPTYTAETDTFTLNNPTKDGYVFTGWTGTGLDGAAMSVTIAKGSTGNREYTATWTGGGSDPEGDVPVFKTYQMKLEGRIEVIFYAEIPEKFRNSDTVMIFDVSGDKSNNNPREFNENFKNDSGSYYGFKCEITSVQMADTITATLSYKDGGETKSTVLKCRAKDYLDYGIEHETDETTLALLKAIQKVLPITAEQDDMLFEHILYHDKSGFRAVYMLQVDSVISEENLRLALDTVSAENEELRSAIVYHHTRVIQQVITDRKIPAQVIMAESADDESLKRFRRMMYLPVDLQRDSLMRVLCAEADGKSYIYIMTCYINFSKAQVLKYLARIMSVLEEKYPGDKSVHEWREIFDGTLTGELQNDTAPRNDSKLKEAVRSKSVTPPEICIYSENSGPHMTFVHTGNTGSEAYYRLAGRIRDRISFSVIEPFNLYHIENATYGITNIAKRYVEILKRHQPEGPYVLGGWCYGGMIAHEMACQLQNAGEDVKYLFMLDSHATTDETLRQMVKNMFAVSGREYFETSPLFADLREAGMLEAMIINSQHVYYDMATHVPSYYKGPATYFKPDVIPAESSGEARKYWERMMEFQAGNYEQFCNKELFRIIHTPHEHDLMIDDPSLDIIVPEIYRALDIK